MNDALPDPDDHHSGADETEYSTTCEQSRPHFGELGIAEDSAARAFRALLVELLKFS